MIIVLDHSALIPCGDKPEEDKEAIRVLGNCIEQVNALLLMSRAYIKVLANKKHDLDKHTPLPKLQAWLRKDAVERYARLVKEEVSLSNQLKVKIIRNATDIISQAQNTAELIKECKELGSEDCEIIALALYGAIKMKRKTLVITSDNKLINELQTIKAAINEEGTTLNIQRPSEATKTLQCQQ